MARRLNGAEVYGDNTIPSAYCPGAYEAVLATLCLERTHGEVLATHRCPALMDMNDPDLDDAKIWLTTRQLELAEEQRGTTLYCQGYQLPLGVDLPRIFRGEKVGFQVDADDVVTVRPFR